jgi:small subunit ribosomal protein S17
MTQDTEKKVRRGKTFQGVVRSDKMMKTVIVEVTRRVLHPTYKKYVTRRARYKAHDEKNDCRVGDVVQIVECRPLSKDKRWRVQKVLEKAG